MSFDHFQSERFIVASYESDFHGRLSVFSLFNRFQELAGVHAENLGVGFDALQANRTTWMLSRIRVEITKMPQWKDTVELTTWAKGIDRLFAMRDFCLRSSDGEALVQATSAWLLVDLDKNRPKRIETLPVDLQYEGAPAAIAETPEKISIQEPQMEVAERVVRLSDIDTNHHMNNAHYARWVWDCIPGDEYSRCGIQSIQINFLDGSMAGERIGIMQHKPEDEQGVYFIAGKNKATGNVKFQARLKLGGEEGLPD